jgi:hypothetical protein
MILVDIEVEGLRGKFVGVPFVALFVLIFYGSPLYPNFDICRDLQFLFDGYRHLLTVGGFCRAKKQQIHSDLTAWQAYGF